MGGVSGFCGTSSWNKSLTSLEIVAGDVTGGDNVEAPCESAIQ